MSKVNWAMNGVFFVFFYGFLMNYFFNIQNQEKFCAENLSIHLSDIFCLLRDGVKFYPLETTYFFFNEVKGVKK